MRDTSEFDEYLGDGVYASFDGYQIWLAVNDHRNKVVALEPGVLNSLDNYRARLNRRIKEMMEGPTDADPLGR